MEGHPFRWVICCLALLGVSFSSVIDAQASPAGYWLLYDKDHKTKRLITKVSVESTADQAKELHFKLVTVWPNKKVGANVFVCTKCKGELQNKTLDSISPLWGNTYSSTTKRWDNGSLLQSHLGRVLTTSLRFDKDYQQASMQVYKLAPVFGVTLNWVRLTPQQVDYYKKETKKQWAQQWVQHASYYEDQKALYLHYASGKSNAELMNQIYSN